MKSLLAALAMTTALTLPAIAMARPVTLTTTLTNYGGDGAYLALYVTDPTGAYAGSLWMAGGKSKYYKHMTDWYRATGGDPAQVDGITGASVGAGRTLDITLDLADALFDAGYTLHIDARGRKHARKPERSGRAADDRRRRHPGHRATLRRRFHLRHVRRQGHDPRSSSLAGSRGSGSRHHSRAQRRGSVRLSDGRAPVRAAGPVRAGRGRPRDAHPDRLSGGRADQAVPLRQDHRLLVRRWHARFRDHRSGNRAGRLPRPIPTRPNAG